MSDAGTYKIDGGEIPLEEVRHLYRPGPLQSRREVQFPGIAERLVIASTPLPPDLTVRGFMVGEDSTRQLAIQSFHLRVDTANALMATKVAHTVVIHGREMKNMELTVFAVLAEPIGISGTDSFPARVWAPVEYQWRRLKA